MLKKRLGLIVLTATLVMTNTMSVYAGEAKDAAYTTAQKYGIAQDCDTLSMAKKTEVLNFMEATYKKSSNENEYMDAFDVTAPSGLTATDYAIILDGTGLQGYGYAFERAEKDYDINGLFLLSLCALESGWGSSYAATAKNNCAGIMRNGTTRNFDSLEECILYTAEMLERNYLSSDGAYYKNGTSPFKLNISYCAQINWAAKIIDIANTQADIIAEAQPIEIVEAVQDTISVATKALPASYIR